MALEVSGLEGIAFLECYRCHPPTYQVVHLVRGEPGDLRAYCHAVPGKDTLEQARGLREGGAPIGQVLEFINEAWGIHDAREG